MTLVLGLAAAWTAAGSLGWIEPSLTRVICWIALAAAIIVSLPTIRVSLQTAAILLGGGAVIAIILLASHFPLANILAVAVVMAAIAGCQSSTASRMLRSASVAIVILSAYRLACETIPAIWHAANAVGRGEGQLIGWLTGRPLRIGASFGGIDFLVLMAALTIGWLRGTARPRRRRAVAVAAAILLAQAVYLVVLAWSCDLADALPPITRPALTDSVSRLGFWTWGNAIHSLMPWNLPVLAAMLHGIVAVGLVIVERNAEEAVITSKGIVGDARMHRVLPAIVALLAGAMLLYVGSRADLSQVKVVAYETGGLDWTTAVNPKDSLHTVPRYGLLPALVADLNGEFSRTADLSGNLGNVLVLLPPKGKDAKPLAPEVQKQIWDYVERGGALLVAAQPETQLGADRNYFSELLARTHIHPRDDTADSVTEHWLHNLQAAPHPATVGLDAGKNQYGIERAVSLRTSWPACPLVTSRWSWSEVGCDLSRPAALPYHPGDPLGDLVLAAREHVGAGTVTVLGDAMCLANDKLPSSYLFTSRLLAATHTAPGAGMQLLGIILVAALVGLVAYRPDPLRTALAAAVPGLALVLLLPGSGVTSLVRPQQDAKGGMPIAYIDTSHMEAISLDTWNDNGLGAFTRILAHNGYLPLLTPDLSADRLRGASLLVSIAPSRSFTGEECDVVRSFVEGGGYFFSMVGATNSGPSRALLNDFGLDLAPVPAPPFRIVRETAPLGALRRQNYKDAGKFAGEVQFYAAWPVHSDRSVGVLGQISEGQETHEALTYTIRSAGKAVLIGDCGFVLNKNLQSEEGLVQGNAKFWRWFLPWLSGRPQPPDDADSLEPSEGQLLDVTKKKEKP